MSVSTVIVNPVFSIPCRVRLRELEEPPDCIPDSSHDACEPYFETLNLCAETIACLSTGYQDVGMRVCEKIEQSPKFNQGKEWDREDIGYASYIENTIAWIVPPDRHALKLVGAPGLRMRFECGWSAAEIAFVMDLLSIPLSLLDTGHPNHFQSLVTTRSVLGKWGKMYQFLKGGRNA